MAFGFDGKKRKPMAEINITPMVDIVFVLLIIFMVAAPLIEQGVDLDLPQTETVPIKSQKDKFIIRVLKGKKKRTNQIFIGKIEVKIDELGEKLKHNIKLQKDKEVYLHASKKLKYGFVVRVMAIIKQSGIPRIALVTEPLEDK